MIRIFIVRPEPGASETAARARALGLDPVCTPLFYAVPVAWAPADPELYDAIMMTSANAARLGGSLLPAYWHLPLFAVGEATAEAARVAGFSHIHSGEGDAEALLEVLRDHGAGRVLHIAGEHHHVPNTPWIRIDRRIVYRVDPIEPPPMLSGAPIILLHSPRAAARVAELIPENARGNRHLCAISANAARAAGTGWASIRIAAAANDDALLAQALKACKGERIAHD